MNSARFHELADIYGGDTARWPIAERVSARWFQARRPLLSHRLLTDARKLDGVLAKSRAIPVSGRLHESISARAPGEPRRERLEGWLRGAWLGAGLAAACAAGIATGFAVTPDMASAVRASIGADPAEDAAAALREPTDLGEA
jgi:hypothetical protein